MSKKYTVKHVIEMVGEKHIAFSQKGLEFLTKRLNGHRWSAGAEVLIEAYVKNRLSHVCGKDVVNEAKSLLDEKLRTNEGVLILALGRLPMFSTVKNGVQERGKTFTDKEEPAKLVSAALYVKANEIAMARAEKAAAEEEESAKAA